MCKYLSRSITHQFPPYIEIRGTKGGISRGTQMSGIGEMLGDRRASVRCGDPSLECIIDVYERDRLARGGSNIHDDS